MKTNTLFVFYGLAVILSALMCLNIVNSNSKIDVLPIILKKNDNKVIKRSPTNFSIPVEKRSFSKLSFKTGKSFLFEYQKSSKKDDLSVEISYSLDEKTFDFSAYDRVEIEIKAEHARRIAFKLGTHNKKKTHHYVQTFIEIKDKKKLYLLDLNDFVTPTSWYHKNDISKDELTQYNSAYLRTISFEACQILAPGIQDKYSVHSITFIKDQKYIVALIAVTAFILIIVGGIITFKPFRKTEKLVFIPIDEKQDTEPPSLQKEVLTYMAKNYSNSNLTLNDLHAEFGRATAELSKLITKETQLTFPQYLSLLRIEAAKKTLSSKNYVTIAEVGYAVGFNSPSNFIRVFKNKEGMSPKKYANSLVEKKQLG